MAGRREGRRAERSPRPSTKGDRSCVGCRGRFARGTLSRLVRAPDGVIHVDRVGKAPGRGAHVCYDPACVEQAIKRRAFGRAFRASVAPVDAETLLAAMVAAVEARIDAALALGRRSGGCVSGQDGIERAWARIRLLVLAADAAENSRTRLLKRAAATGCPTVDYGSAAALGRSQGNDLRVAVGVTDTGLAERLTLEFVRRSRVLVAA